VYDDVELWLDTGSEDAGAKRHPSTRHSILKGQARSLTSAHTSSSDLSIKPPCLFQQTLQDFDSIWVSRSRLIIHGVLIIGVMGMKREAISGIQHLIFRLW
jgi:hypothetical protein